MADQQSNVEELITLIEAAFDGVPQPTEITLHVAEAYDSFDYEHDDVHRKSDFVGRWQDVPSEDIKECQSALSFVDAVGMRFYLPAYMTWYLANFYGEDNESDHTLYSLDDHSGDAELSRYHQERFALFAAEQMRACALFVKHCAEDPEDYTDTAFAREVFERYWSKFVTA